MGNKNFKNRRLMNLNKQEAENIMSMLLSVDKENSIVATAALEAFDFNGSDVGYLIYFYKFSKYDDGFWSENAPKSYKRLKETINVEKPLTTANAIKTMLSLQTNIDSIELMLNRHVVELRKMLESMGYPIEKLVLNLKLKDNE
jgi:hypothetical protein